MTTVVEPPAPATSGDAAGAIELRGIGKRFPGVIANHDIDITIRTGPSTPSWGRTVPASPR